VTRIVMTLLVRDEVDVVARQLDYHIDAGVDFVVAIDHNSVDGTTDVLRDYEQRGLARVLPPPSEDLHLRQGEWVTRLARLAASEYGADWVINADADEFWWPRGGSLKEVLEAVPPAFGAVRGLMRHFVPRPEGPQPFFERMIARHRCMVERTHPYHFQVKVAHRGAADVEVAYGNHDAYGAGLRLLREWIPIEVLHFPLRSPEQMARKYRPRPGHSPYGSTAADELAVRGTAGVWADYAVDDECLARGIADRMLAVDVRVRDALRTIEPVGARVEPAFAPESAAEAERAFVADMALFMETDAAIGLGARAARLDARLHEFRRAQGRQRPHRVVAADRGR
jgi:hypothetical protein